MLGDLCELPPLPLMACVILAKGIVSSFSVLIWKAEKTATLAFKDCHVG